MLSFSPYSQHYICYLILKNRHILSCTIFSQWLLYILDIYKSLQILPYYLLKWWMMITAFQKFFWCGIHEINATRLFSLSYSSFILFFPWFTHYTTSGRCFHYQNYYQNSSFFFSKKVSLADSSLSLLFIIFSIFSSGRYFLWYAIFYYCVVWKLQKK
jgi:hypothetical protein